MRSLELLVEAVTKAAQVPWEVAAASSVVAAPVLTWELEWLPTLQALDGVLMTGVVPYSIGRCVARVALLAYVSAVVRGGVGAAVARDPSGR